MIFSQKQAKNILYIFSIFFIFFPLLPRLLPGNMGHYIVLIMELFFVFVCGTFHVFKASLTVNSFIVFLLFLFNIIISILCDLFNSYLIIRDLFEMVNPFAFLLFYTLYRKSNLSISILESMVLHVIITSFLILSVYSIFEFLLPAIVRPISIFLYQMHAHSNTRAAGSFGVSYQFGYILLLPLMYSIIYFLKSISIKNFVFFSLFFITLLLTQSRSIYITCAIGFGVVLCLPFFYSNIRVASRVIGIMLIIVFALVNVYLHYQEELKELIGYAIYGFINISRGSDISVDIRSEQLLFAINNNKSILFGSGISKGITQLESFYSLYYYRYGLISISVYLIMLINTAIVSYRIAKYETVNLKIKIFYLSLFVFFLISPVGLLNSNHQDTPKISFLFYGLIGLVYNKYHYIKNKI
jgi:hypothetical protein